VQYADGGTASGRWPKNNRFHTAALCSPTRQALLTGRNHHTVGMGGITEIATGSPGYNSVLPNICSPIARTLKLNGYAAARFGKCHEVPVGETSPAGPFDAWPTGGGGFEYFYGFLGGEANQWYPSLYEGTTPIEGKVSATEAIIFSGDDGCDVGVDTGAPVSPDYGSRGNEFSGRIKGVQLAIAEDAESVDHLVSPEEAIRIAMARQ
jgi:Sulfatase